jgi:hypothetical protein
VIRCDASSRVGSDQLVSTLVEIYGNEMLRILLAFSFYSHDVPRTIELNAHIVRVTLSLSLT